MPLKDNRTSAGTRDGKFATSGRRDVVYRDTAGRSWDALVVDQGTASGLLLRITSDNGRQVDNVAKATTMKSTNAYFSRTD